MATAPVKLSKQLPMSDRILVTGATGLQGGAVARHLLKLGKPEVRCLTRRPDSEAAKTFKQLGAEVVKADLDDPASLKSVLRGCTGVFGVTDFWEAFLREYDQGVNLCLAKIKSACEINNIQRCRVTCYTDENCLVRSFGEGQL
jgi:putative NADH-flavin reductase